MTRVYERKIAGASCMVWPQAPAWEGLATAAIGRFHCDAVPAGRALLEQVAEELHSIGTQAVIGPMDGDTWHSYRLMIEGGEASPHFIMEPPHDPVALSALTEAGFAAIAHYASGIADLSAVRAGLGSSPDIRLRLFDPVRGDLATIHRISNLAFAKAPFFTPLAWEEFETLYAPLLLRLLPKLVLLAEEANGEALGFVFGMPDPQPGLVILKTYASLRPGVGALLCNGFHANARQLGFTRVVHALMHETNLSLRHSHHMGATIFRRYALFGRKLA